MKKTLDILKEHDLEIKKEYLDLKNQELMLQMKLMTLEEGLHKAAQEVLNGNCPHEREQMGSVVRTCEPRNFIKYSETIPLFGKCKLCGE